MQVTKVNLLPETGASTEDKRAAQVARAKKFGVEALIDKGERLSIPSGFPDDLALYGDPVNLKFPMDSEGRAANARVRFKQFADTYTKEKSKRIVHERIVRRELSLGIDAAFDEDDHLDLLLPKELRDQMTTKAIKLSGEVFVAKQAEGTPEDEVRFFGIVAKVMKADSDGEGIPAQEIVRSNEKFMKSFGTTGFMHAFSVSDKVAIVQNVIAPINFDFPLPDGGVKKIDQGTWYQELYSWDSEITGKIRRGEIKGLSLGGHARIVPVDSEAGKAALGDQESLVAFKAAKGMDDGSGGEINSLMLNLSVEEVSLVDAAANLEEFFIVKRREDEAAPAEPEQARGIMRVIEEALKHALAPILGDIESLKGQVNQGEAETLRDLRRDLTKLTETVGTPGKELQQDESAVALRGEVEGMRGALKTLGEELKTLGEELKTSASGTTALLERLEVIEAKVAVHLPAAKGARNPAAPPPTEVKRSRWGGTAVSALVDKTRR